MDTRIARLTSHLICCRNVSDCNVLTSLTFSGVPTLLSELHMDSTSVRELPEMRAVPLRLLSAKGSKIHGVDKLASLLTLKTLIVDYTELPAMPDWSFDRSDMAISALPHCKRGEVLVTDRKSNSSQKEACKRCDRGSYTLNGGGDATCEKRGCGEDIQCDGGFDVVPMNGYWRGRPYFRTTVGIGYLKDSSDLNETCDEARCSITSDLHATALPVVHVYACGNADACILNDGQYPMCADGYHGPLCAHCVERYVWSEGHICTNCEGQSTSVWRALAISGLVIAAVIMFLFRVAKPLFAPVLPTRPQPRSNLCLLCLQRTMANLANPESYVRRSYARMCEFYEEVKVRLELFGHAARALIGFFQVVGNLGSIGVRWPFEFDAVASWFNFAKISFEVPSVACMISESVDYTFYKRHLLYTLGPLVVLLLVSLPVLWARLRRLPASTIADLHERHIRSALFVVFLLYPKVRASLFCVELLLLFRLARHSWHQLRPLLASTKLLNYDSQVFSRETPFWSIYFRAWTSVVCLSLRRSRSWQ